MDLSAAPEFLQIVMADIILSGDNALIIGLAAASLPPELRRKAIVFGMLMAAVLRIIFAVSATYLLSIQGLLFVGGLLLVWVCWRLYNEIRQHTLQAAEQTISEADHEIIAPKNNQGSLTKALVSITIADVSMSLDNVLAVAAIARDNTALLVFGLVLAIALMGFCASMIVHVLNRYPAISWLGLVVLLYVAGGMLWDGWPDMAALIGLAI